MLPWRLERNTRRPFPGLQKTWRATRSPIRLPGAIRRDPPVRPVQLYSSSGEVPSRPSSAVSLHVAVAGVAPNLLADRLHNQIRRALSASIDPDLPRGWIG